MVVKTQNNLLTGFVTDQYPESSVDALLKATAHYVRNVKDPKAGE